MRTCTSAAQATTTAVCPVEEARALVRACAEGDGDARRRFQEEFAEDVYNFPIKMCGMSAEKAADFYVYAFERDRIFLRIRSYEGRGGMQFRAYLAFHALRGLFLDWQRGERELDTVSLSAPVGRSESGVELGDLIPASERTRPSDTPVDERFVALWQSLAPEERLDIKLLSLLEHDLAPDDIRLLARISRRSIEATVAVVAEVQTTLRVKDMHMATLADELDSAWGWLVLRRRELHEAEEELRLMKPTRDRAARDRLVRRCQDLATAIEKRSQQHARALDEIRSYRVTTSYRDIAKLKNSAVGTVGSRMLRLRQRLERRWPGTDAAS
jgi:RNA polymerase sigma factor (sigma-70 family)